MYLYYLIFSIIFIVILLRSRKNIFHPIIIYLFIWLLSVSLYSLKLIPYYDTSLTTWSILFLVPLTILLGYYFANLIYKKNKSYLELNIRFSSIKIFLLVFGSLLIFRNFSVWLGIYLRFGSFLAGFTEGETIYALSRAGIWGPGIGLFIPVDAIAAFFVGIYYQTKGKVDFLILFILFNIVFLNIGLQSRFALLNSISIFFASYIGSNRVSFNLNLKYLVYLAATVTFILFIISNSRNLSEVNSISGDFGDLSTTFLPSLYFYLTNGIAGLNEYINIGIDEYDRLYTFDPILRFYSIFDSDVFVENYETTYYYTPIRTIIATWIRFLIDDFGYSGMFIYLFVVGLILRLSELKLEEKRSVFWISIYAHIMGLFVLSFFGYNFFLNNYWFSLIICSFLGILIDSGLSNKLFSDYLTEKK